MRAKKGWKWRSAARIRRAPTCATSALIAGAAAKLGVFRFRFADTLGLLDPFSTYEYIKRLREETDLPVEFHGHNDLGLATANTLAAMRAAPATPASPCWDWASAPAMRRWRRSASPCPARRTRAPASIRPG